MAEEYKSKLDAEIKQYKQIQKDIQKSMSKRQQLDSQLNENTVVKEELDILNDKNEVFKFIGPILIKQDLVEAKDNINKRIKYINEEIKRTDDQLETLNKKQQDQRENVEKYQRLIQQIMEKNIKLGKKN